MLRYELETITTHDGRTAYVQKMYCACDSDIFFNHVLTENGHWHPRCGQCDQDYCLSGCVIPETSSNEQENLAWTGTSCSVCGNPQFDVDGCGTTCAQGHGGADGF